MTTPFRKTSRSSLLCCLIAMLILFPLAANVAAFAKIISADGFPTSPDHVTASPAGCRNNGGITLPDGGGYFICHPDTPNTPSTDVYTGGDLGKNWAELDLVPFRL